METMAARKKKATILLENIKEEYETAMQDIQAEMTEGTPNAASAEWVVDEAQWIICLYWVKKRIIDEDGRFFCEFFRGYDDGNYVFRTSEDDINMMISISHEARWIKRLFFGVIEEYKDIYFITEVQADNIGSLMFSALESLMYKKNGTI